MSVHRSPKTSRRRRNASVIALAATMSLQLFGVTGAHAAAAVGLVSSFGANAYGELGNNSTTNASSPVAVSGLPLGATTFAAGSRHSLAILPDTSVVAWGRNGSGELGINNKTGPTVCSGVSSACSLTPVHVTSTSGSGTLSGAIAVDGGAPACSASIPCTSHVGHSMVLLTDQTGLGWGHRNSREGGGGV